MIPRLVSSKGSYPMLQPDSKGPRNAGATLPFPAHDGALPVGFEDMKLQRKGSKVWSEIRSALKAMGRNSCGSKSDSPNTSSPAWLTDSDSQGSTILEGSPEDARQPFSKGRSPTGKGKGSDTSSVSRKAKALTPKELIRKFRLDHLGLGQNDTVVLRNLSPKKRGSLQALSCSDSDSSSGRNDTWSPTYGGSRQTSPEDNSTTKTSVDSRFSHATSSKGGPNRKLSRRSRWTRSSPEGAGLGTIEESGLVHTQPTIITVESAAAAKIYIETHFNELCNKPQARSIRQQYLESQLFYSTHLAEEQKNAIRQSFYHQENCHLREMRALKSQTTVGIKMQDAHPLLAKYQSLKVLGKGSFGVVRLVREVVNPYQPFSNQVYAMKVIRKSAMLRSSQEGHLRAERDFLVSSEGCTWVVPLVASFEDLTSLYLVMEYMPGGDFLGLLIRENILHEAVARFYIAEMILAVEEAHRLKFIHRDIKPDNFLISSSGHLKISDFGLAFDGHWSHDASYYNFHRYSLLRKLGIHVDGDIKDQEDSKTIQGRVGKTNALTTDLGRHNKRDATNVQDLDDLLEWRNRCGNRSRANSVVGTSQYMAPEWSIGIILYECLYGHTPFLSDEGRKPTKQNILAHKQNFRFPLRPPVSDRCKDLIYRMIQDKENRLCCRRYHMLDRGQIDASNSTDMFGRYVFVNDAEDIKNHRWFKNIPWDRLHALTPPFIPHISSSEDTHYFDESDPIDERSESAAETTELNPEEVRTLLRGFRPRLQDMAIDLITTPYDSGALRSRELRIESSNSFSEKEKELLKRFMREYGRRMPKRPRDIILRDEKTKHVAMEVRKQTAFIGYAWQRMRPGGYMMSTWVS